MARPNKCITDVTDADGNSLPRAEGDSSEVTCVQGALFDKLDNPLKFGSQVTRCIVDQNGIEFEVDPVTGNTIIPNECTTNDDGTLSLNGHKLGTRRRTQNYKYVLDAGIINTPILNTGDIVDEQVFKIGDAYQMEVVGCEAFNPVRLDVDASIVLEGDLGETAILDWAPVVSYNGGPWATAPESGTQRLCKPQGCGRVEGTVSFTDEARFPVGTHDICFGYQFFVSPAEPIPPGFQVFAALSGAHTHQDELFCCGS